MNQFTAVFENPVASLASLTVACGTGAPAESVMIPVTVPAVSLRDCLWSGEDDGDKEWQTREVPGNFHEIYVEASEVA